MSVENKLAFVFPGQGSQEPEMASSLLNHPETEISKLVHDVFEEASDELRLDMMALCTDPTKIWMILL